MITGITIDFYSTGQLTDGVHGKQVVLWFFDTVNRAAGCLGVSNWGHPRSLLQSWIFDNPVVGLVMGDALQLQSSIH